MNVGVVLVAAGEGARLGADEPKAFVELAGRTLLEHALDRAVAAEVGSIVLVVPDRRREQARVIADAVDPAIAVVGGGAERTHSVAAGLVALPASIDKVLIHDAARCLAPTALFNAVALKLAAGAEAVVPGLPVADTIKEVDSGGRVLRTVERGPLRSIQTPQGFSRKVLERAHASRLVASDDAALVERIGGTVLVIAGDPMAFKITTPSDLLLAKAHLR